MGSAGLGVSGLTLDRGPKLDASQSIIARGSPSGSANYSSNPAWGPGGTPVEELSLGKAGAFSTFTEVEVSNASAPGVPRTYRCVAQSLQS
jgi:hypothetical protein